MFGLAPIAGQTLPVPQVPVLVLLALLALLALGVGIRRSSLTGSEAPGISEYVWLDPGEAVRARPLAGPSGTETEITSLVGRELYTESGVYVGTVRDLVFDLDREVVAGLAVREYNEDLERLPAVEGGVVVPYGLVRSVGDIVHVTDWLAGDGDTEAVEPALGDAESGTVDGAATRGDTREGRAGAGDGAAGAGAPDAGGTPSAASRQLREDVAAARTDLRRRGEEDVAAWRSLFDLERSLASLRERAAEVGADTLRSEIDTLESERADRFEAVHERLTDRYVPDRVPGAPDVAVDHDALTDETAVGSGGAAEVSRCRLPTADGDVTLAVKRPRMEGGTLHTAAAERLLAEAETWAGFDEHDHVVVVVDYGREPLPWIAMEYMDGGHLGARAGELPLPEALLTAIGIAEGVRHAHRHGVAHLDLKPANVLFREVDGAWDVPKVADWGLSKELIDAAPEVEGVSVDYAAPEQLAEDRGPVDDRTDIYGLGAVCYELFTGRPPFEGPRGEVADAVLTASPPLPSRVADVPAALDEPITTALSKDRTDRYDNAAYFRDALRDLFEP